MGVPAAAGRLIQVELGLQAMRSNDLLLLAVEPDYYGVDPVRHFGFGSKLWHLSVKGRDLVGDSKLPLIGVDEPYPYLSHMRPEGRHVVTMLMKVALGRDMYRYTVSDIRGGGYLQTAYEDPGLAPGSRPRVLRLGSEMRAFLVAIRDYCKSIGGYCAVTIPWRYVTEDAAEGERRAVDALMAEIGSVVPVVRDPYRGVRTERTTFADTIWHLSPEGGAERTRLLGKGIIELGIPGIPAVQR